jgi:3-oxoadipate enol-lactonase
MNEESKGYDLIADLDSFKLSYDDIGEGSTPVIFLHGYPFDKTMWEGQIKALKSTNRLIACDIRGFGKSADEESLLSIDLFGDDLITFMDKLDLNKVIICGLSMGGFIALNAYGRFPDRFEALILCDTQCIADTPEVRRKRYQVMEEIAVDGVKNFNEGFIKSVFHEDSLADKVDLVEKLRSVVFSNSQHIIIMGLTALAERSETCSILSEIVIPTLIICGREDEVTPLSQSQFMNANIEGSVLHVIDNAGHVSNLEQPDAFNSILLDFLSALSSLDFEQINGDQRMA